MNEQEKAYLAGIIDGEGSIFIGKTYRRLSTMVVNVSNTDPRLHVWLREKVGGHVTEDRRKYPSRRRIWLWQISSDKATDMLIEILPYLVIKRDQAQTAIDFHKLKAQCNRKGRKRGMGSEEYNWRLAFYQRLKDLKVIPWAATTERGDIKIIDEATVCAAPKDAELAEMTNRQAKFGFLN